VNVCSIILKVMGCNQYIVNKPLTLTGIHQLELRLLSKMGYELLVVITERYVLLSKTSLSTCWRY